MLAFWKKLSEKWSNWVGDRDLEILLRSRLKNRGYRGDGARFESVRLVAIKRPGWVQVYSFQAIVRPMQVETDGDGGGEEKLYGLVRQDERGSRTDVEFFTDPAPRRRLFRDWSEGLITLRNERL
ncbi:MAG: hypothetical protein Aurels2KO_18200 [Aureliella sp.]